MIDITAPLGPATPRYPGDPPVELQPLSTAGDGETFALSRLCLGTHAGTHVDPPSHLLAGGASVDELALETLIGPARLIAAAYGRPVAAADLTGIGRARRILIHTGGMPLAENAARMLAERGVRLLGVDGLSVDPVDQPGPAHRILLTAGIVIVEGLALAGVPAGAYTLICLPLKLAGGDGAPARAVLIERRRERERGWTRMGRGATRIS